MLDHGMLNVPLARRGNIDAQLDRYKADRAREAKIQAKADAARKKLAQAEAKRLVASLTADDWKRWADILRMTPAQAKKRITSDAHWQPERVIKAIKPKESA